APWPSGASRRLLQSGAGAALGPRGGLCAAEREDPLAAHLRMEPVEAVGLPRREHRLGPVFVRHERDDAASAARAGQLRAEGAGRAGRGAEVLELLRRDEEPREQVLVEVEELADGAEVSCLDREARVAHERLDRVEA